MVVNDLITEPLTWANPPGEIGAEEIEATGDRRYAIGDRVIAAPPHAACTHPADPTPTSATERSAASSPSAGVIDPTTTP